MMSGNESGSPEGWYRDAENSAARRQRLERIQNSLLYVFTSSIEPRRVSGITPAGFAHTFAVCMLEIEIMTRGSGKNGKGGNAATMPKFVDIKLTQEDKADFLKQNYDDKFLVTVLQSLCDDGYRVGCTWDAERQAYTVSLTCRNPESSNNGLCMTSFAKTIRTAVGLAVYKHTVITEEIWLGEAGSGSEDFG